MRTILVLFSAALLAQGCQGNSGDKITGEDSLLSTSLVHNPASGDAAPADSRELPTLTFTDTAHAFGTIKEGETVEHSFSFTNSGKAPLLITGATASCGCTVPDYPREPVAPGSGGVIRVSFNSKGKPGHQEKTVTVTSNTARGTQYLNISAEVSPAE